MWMRRITNNRTILKILTNFLLNWTFKYQKYWNSVFSLWFLMRSLSTISKLLTKLPARITVYDTFNDLSVGEKSNQFSIHTLKFSLFHFLIFIRRYLSIDDLQPNLQNLSETSILMKKDLPVRFWVAVEFGFACAARVSEHFFRPILFSGHSRVGGGSSAAAPKFCGVFRELSDSFLKKDYVKGTNGEVCHWDTPFSLFYFP